MLGEYTNRNDLAHFIFGTLPGWWASEDGRKNGPLLSQSEWNSALKDVGFSGSDLSLADNGDNEAHRMSTIVSTKPPENGHILSKRVVIITPDGCNATTQSLASLLAKKMENLGSTAVVSQLSDSSIIAEGKSIVSLLDYEASFLEDLSEIHFEQVKHLLLSSSEILWVTRSDPADGPGHPTKRIISGLLRCLKTEDASRRPHELHFSRDLFSDIEPVSETIHRSMCTILGASLQASQEMETAERDGIFCIPRYMPNTAMNRSLAQTKDVDLAPEVDKLLQPKRPFKMTIGQPGMLDTLHFVDDEDCSNPLPDEAVEIEVQACALNFLYADLRINLNLTNNCIGTS